MSDSSESETRKCRGTCGARKPLAEFNFNGQVSRAGVRYHQTQCRVCQRVAQKVVRRIRKVAGPPPPLCEICEEEPATCCDHDHRTGDFRGWLCSPCNRALGMLGDDIQGIRSALAYLERAQTRSTVANSCLDGEERARSRSPRRDDDSGGAPASPEGC